MNKIKKIIFVFVFCAAIFFNVFAQEQKKLPVTLDIYESGSFVQQSALTNRMNVRLYMPLSFMFRLTSAHEAPVPPKGEFKDGNINFGLGLYHQKTGSRILYGTLETSGLSKRSANVFSHSAPWLETHTVSNADLKTTALESAKNEFYAQLISPRRKIFNGKLNLENFYAYFAPHVSADKNTDWTAGVNYNFGRASSIRSEFFWTQKTLPQRKSLGWFSDKIYLQERDMRYYAASLVFTNPYVSAAFDFAQSQIFSWGSDIYANGALRIGSSPWRVSLAVDASGSRYSSSTGAIVGAGLRSAAKFEWFGMRSSFFKISTTLKSPGIDNFFDQSSSIIYYRFPVIKNFLVTPARLSFEMDHNAHDRYAISDVWTIKSLFNAGPVRPSFDVAIKQSSTAQETDKIFPYINFQNDHKFESVKFTAAISTAIPVSKIFINLKASGSLTKFGEKENDSNNLEDVWNAAFYAGISGKYGRLNVKCSNTGKDSSWLWTITWKLQKTFDTKKSNRLRKKTKTVITES
ncbi:MAG: hypothetical protein Ta2F_00110 [Termitinemataceae bacterium]|nr:MAG: hypothetical protein Ta2F_00110 [Termitinemataceae bacterium]